MREVALGTAKIPKGRIKAPHARQGAMAGLAHTPFSDVMGGVPGQLQLGRDHRHVAWRGSLRGAIVKLLVHVRRVPSREKGGAGRSAVVVDVVPVKFDALFDEAVDVGRLGMRVVVPVSFRGHTRPKREGGRERGEMKGHFIV